jgi:hypothetical protein
MTLPLTRVHLLHRPKTADDWLRFGRPVRTRSLDRRTSQALFTPGSVFALVRWRAGDFGTVDWRLWVLRAVAPGEAASTVSGVDPGAELLLAARGEGPVRRAFAVIDAIEAQGLDPAEAPAAYWQAAHNRLAAYLEPRPYGPAERAALLRRRRASP